MNVEEQRLAEWLREITPEPPRPVDLRAVAGRVAAQPPTRRRSHTVWLPLLAAACVVGVIAGLALVLHSNGHVRPAHRTHSSVSTGTPTAVHATPPPEPLAVRPWGAVRVAGLALRPNSMVGYRGRLYALGESGKLLEIDPASGRVVASAAPTPGTRQIDDFAVASGSVWTAGAAGGSTVRVERYDAPTLQPLAGAQFGGSSLNADRYGALLAAYPGHGGIFVGGGRTVHLLDDNLTPVRTFTVPEGQISDFATSPDGSTLYVASGPELEQRIYVFDVRTAGRLGTVDLGPGAAGGLGGLQPTARGLFLTSAEGHAANVLFASFPFGRSVAPRSEGWGGGGFFPQATLSGGVAWIGGYRLACADPRTGRIRATAQVPPNEADISAMTVVDHRLYAVYEGRRHALVTLHPPASCELR